MRDAPLLILDEPTNALDPAAERLLMDALGNLLKGRTAFVIAHRMSTVSRADQCSSSTASALWSEARTTPQTGSRRLMPR